MRLLDGTVPAAAVYVLGPGIPDDVALELERDRLATRVDGHHGERLRPLTSAAAIDLEPSGPAATMAPPSTPERPAPPAA